MKNSIAIIGGGNLGSSIAQGLINSKYIAAKNIIVTRRKLSLLEPLKEQGIQISSDNSRAITNSNVVIIAVKPHQVNEVLSEIKGIINEIKPIFY